MDRNIESTNRLSAALVVPYVGTWIEILASGNTHPQDPVVPYVGTWIEILRSASTFQKYVVVPYVGTWIEI